jgi:ABC-type transport system involved in cytochrome c biogenesis permease component
MNATLVAAFLRQRFTSPMRVGLLALVTVFPLGGRGAHEHARAARGIASPIAFILAAGAIGQDVSSGTLQLLLVRPVSRPSVLVHRWLSSALAATAITMLMLILGSGALVLRGTHPDALDLIRMVLEALCSAAG